MDGDQRSNVTSLRPFLAAALERQQPYNPQAEQAVLGMLMIDNNSYYRVSEYLQPIHFGNAVHGRIFAAIGKLVERGQVANPVSLKTVFDQDEALRDIGGSRYLGCLASEAGPLVNTEDYARAVHDLYLRRQLIAVGEDVVNDAYKQDLDDPAKEQIERFESKLFELGTTGQISEGLRPFKVALTTAIEDAAAAYKRDGKTTGVATGFVDLDDKLGGLHASDLVVVAGRPGMGKTSLGTNIAFNAALSYRPGPARGSRAEDGASVAFFSLEMSAEQLAARILGEQSGVPSDQIRRGKVTSADFDRFVQTSRQLAALPLFIDDTPALTIASVRRRARRLLRTTSLGLIVVDYLQLMGSAPGQRVENRVQEVSAITKGLKGIAKELKVPVVAVSQLSRAVELREDKRPLLSDLRESGTIEQDADVVLFVFREEYYLREPDPADLDKWSAWRDKMEVARNKAELIIAKNRQGPTGTVYLRFNAATTRFENLCAGGPPRQF